MVGTIGGALFGGRPDLAVTGARTATEDRGAGRVVEHRVEVRNDGSSAAEECAGSLRFEGTDDRPGGEGEWARFAVAQTAVWAAADAGERSIPPEETVDLALFRTAVDDGGEGGRVQFPTDGEWDADGRPVDRYRHRGEEILDVELYAAVTLEQFVATDWGTASLSIEAANASGVAVDLDVGPSEDSPDGVGVSIDAGGNEEESMPGWKTP